MTKIPILLKSETVIFVALTAIVLLFSCKKEENNNIPLVLVDITININDPAYLDLKTVGGSVEVVGGSKGIILYRKSTEEINAFDRHCTFDPSNSCSIISADLNRSTATDQCCGSSFLLNSGDVSMPPASTPLKAYKTSFDGTTLRVFN